MSQCKYCGAEIDFVRQPHTGVWIPVEARPVLYDGKGSTEILTVFGEKKMVHEVKAGPKIGLYIGYRPHRLNCPHYREEPSVESEEEEDDDAWWKRCDL